MKVPVQLCGAMLFTLALFGCDSGANSSVASPARTDTAAAAKDSVWFASVVPDSVLTPGRKTVFTISLGYKLTTKDEGIIGVGFNDGSVVTSMSVQKSLIVAKGSGTKTFQVSSTVKDWGTQGGYAVFALMTDSPYSGGPALAGGQKILIPQK